MPQCKAFGCSSHDGRLPRHIRLHCFPKDRGMCGIWAQNMGISSNQIENFLDMACSDNQSIRRRFRICTLHFEPHCFEQNFQFMQNPRILLKPNAIPTIFQTNNVPTPKWYTKLKLNSQTDVRQSFIFL